MQFMYQGVLLDIDGTLVDSNDVHARAWVDALIEQGYSASFEDVRPLIGTGGDTVLPKIARLDSDSPEGKKIDQRRGEIFKTRFLPSVKPFPQVRALLLRMRESGLKLVIATSAKPAEADPLLQLADVSDLIDVQTTSDDAEHSKPAPDIIQAALKKSGLAAASVLMLGDTPYDIKSARKVGVSTLVVRCGGGWTDSDFKDALAIYDDPADLLAHYDQSPLAQG